MKTKKTQSKRTAFAILAGFALSFAIAASYQSLMIDSSGNLNQFFRSLKQAQFAYSASGDSALLASSIGEYTADSGVTIDGVLIKDGEVDGKDISTVLTDPTTTKGDLIVNDGSGIARLAAGTDGYLLSADSSESTGLKWTAASGVGDMLKSVYDPANIAEQLVGLTASQILSNKYLTTPGINDSALNNYYLFSTADLTANRTVSLPLLTTDDTFVFEDYEQTLTNKTLTSPVINSPTGLTKSDVGLDQVDNTSDATKNSATATLTNKTLASPVINVGSDADGDLYTRISGNLTRIPKGTTGQFLQQSGTVAQWVTLSYMSTSIYDPANVAEQLVGLTAAQTLTNKTLTSPSITSPTIDTSISGSAVLDEDDMASDSATQIATQQSIKAYVDNTKTDYLPLAGGTMTGDITVPVWPAFKLAFPNYNIHEYNNVFYLAHTPLTWKIDIGGDTIINNAGLETVNIKTSSDITKDCSVTDQTYSLPSTSNDNDGFIYRIGKTGSYKLTITAGSGDDIADTTSTLTSTNKTDSFVALRSDYTNNTWRIISASGDWAYSSRTTLPQSINGDKLYYDTTINIPSGATNTEIQTAINNCPKNLNSNSLTIQFADDTYTISSSVTFSSFFAGTLNVFGNTTESESIHATQAVILDSHSYAVNTLLIDNCTCKTNIKFLRCYFKSNVDGPNAIVVKNSKTVDILYSYMQGNSRTYGAGMLFEASSGWLKNNAIRYTLYAIRAYGAGSHITSEDNDDITNKPSYGLSAEAGGLIAKVGTIQPTGYNSDEITATGGEIR